MYSVFPSRNGLRSQGGAALILALVVFSIVALLASSLSMNFLVSVRRVENQLNGQQALAYLRGAEGLARAVLLNDLTSGPDKDHLSEGWLNFPQEYPMETGVISGVICDLQGRFNLNNLRGASSQQGEENSGGPRTYTGDQELFIRLLQLLPLESPLDVNQAETIANAVIDWVSNPNPLTFGEDYSDKEPPYRAGHKLFRRASELRWVEGITDEIYRALEPHVIVLPVEGTALNINTAGVFLLRSINEAKMKEPLTEADGQRLVERRDGDIASGDLTKINQGFTSVQEFMAEIPLTGQGGLTLDVKSNYFLVQSSVVFLDNVSTLYSVLHRAGNNIKTIARGQSDLGSCNSLLNEAVNSSERNDII